MTTIAILGAAVSLSVATAAATPSRSRIQEPRATNHSAPATQKTCQEAPRRSQRRVVTFGALGK
jgi:hypothetical protein